MYFGDFINQKRKEQNMSIDELVKKSNIPKGTLSKITAGINTNPTLTTVKALCKALNCSLDDALDFEKESSFTADELYMIKKYRALDMHGIKMVDFVLNEEYARCEGARKTIQGETTVPTAIAAQGGGINTEISPESENAVLSKLEELDKNERKNDLGL